MITLQIENLTPEQIAQCQRHAQVLAQPLDDWLVDAVTAALEAQARYVERLEREAGQVPWVQPEWATGLSVRTAKCLCDAGYHCISTVRRDFDELPKEHFLTIPNFGKRCYLELANFFIK